MATEKRSKSALKREFHALQSLGEELLRLTEEQLSRIAMDATLREAVLHARTIKSHGALRRQKQLIGKLMRHTDVNPIQDAVDHINAGARQRRYEFRDAEVWRDRIVAEGRVAIDEYCAISGRDNQALRELWVALESTFDDRRRKEIKRNIFREIHRDLGSKVQNDAN